MSNYEVETSLSAKMTDSAEDDFVDVDESPRNLENGTTGSHHPSDSCSSFDVCLNGTDEYPKIKTPGSPPGDGIANHDSDSGANCLPENSAEMSQCITVDPKQDGKMLCDTELQKLFDDASLVPDCSNNQPFGDPFQCGSSNMKTTSPCDWFDLLMQPTAPSESGDGISNNALSNADFSLPGLDEAALNENQRQDTASFGSIDSNTSRCITPPVDASVGESISVASPVMTPSFDCHLETADLPALAADTEANSARRLSTPDHSCTSDSELSLDNKRVITDLLRSLDETLSEGRDNLTEECSGLPTAPATSLPLKVELIAVVPHFSTASTTSDVSCVSVSSADRLAIKTPSRPSSLASVSSDRTSKSLDRKTRQQSEDWKLFVQPFVLLERLILPSWTDICTVDRNESRSSIARRKGKRHKLFRSTSSKLASNSSLSKDVKKELPELKSEFSANDSSSMKKSKVSRALIDSSSDLDDGDVPVTDARSKETSSKSPDSFLSKSDVVKSAGIFDADGIRPLAEFASSDVGSVASSSGPISVESVTKTNELPVASRDKPSRSESSSLTTPKFLKYAKDPRFQPIVRLVRLPLEFFHLVGHPLDLPAHKQNKRKEKSKSATQRKLSIISSDDDDGVSDVSAMKRSKNTDRRHDNHRKGKSSSDSRKEKDSRKKKRQRSPSPSLSNDSSDSEPDTKRAKASSSVVEKSSAAASTGGSSAMEPISWKLERLKSTLLGRKDDDKKTKKSADSGSSRHRESDKGSSKSAASSEKSRHSEAPKRDKKTETAAMQLPQVEKNSTSAEKESEKKKMDASLPDSQTLPLDKDPEEDSGMKGTDAAQVREGTGDPGIDSGLRKSEEEKTSADGKEGAVPEKGPEKEAFQDTEKAEEREKEKQKGTRREQEREKKSEKLKSHTRPIDERQASSKHRSSTDAQKGRADQKQRQGFVIPKVKRSEGSTPLEKPKPKHEQYTAIGLPRIPKVASKTPLVVADSSDVSILDKIEKDPGFLRWEVATKKPDSSASAGRGAAGRGRGGPQVGSNQPGPGNNGRPAPPGMQNNIGFGRGIGPGPGMRQFGPGPGKSGIPFAPRGMAPRMANFSVRDPEEFSADRMGNRPGKPGIPFVAREPAPRMADFSVGDPEEFSADRMGNTPTGANRLTPGGMRNPRTVGPLSVGQSPAGGQIPTIVSRSVSNSLTNSPIVPRSNSTVGLASPSGQGLATPIHFPSPREVDAPVPQPRRPPLLPCPDESTPIPVLLSGRSAPPPITRRVESLGSAGNFERTDEVDFNAADLWKNQSLAVNTRPGLLGDCPAEFRKTPSQQSLLEPVPTETQPAGVTTDDDVAQCLAWVTEAYNDYLRHGSLSEEQINRLQMVYDKLRNSEPRPSTVNNPQQTSDQQSEFKMTVENQASAIPRLLDLMIPSGDFSGRQQHISEISRRPPLLENPHLIREVPPVMLPRPPIVGSRHGSIDRDAVSHDRLNRTTELELERPYNPEELFTPVDMNSDGEPPSPLESPVTRQTVFPQLSEFSRQGLINTPTETAASSARNNPQVSQSVVDRNSSEQSMDVDLRSDRFRRSPSSSSSVRVLPPLVVEAPPPPSPQDILAARISDELALVEILVKIQAELASISDAQTDEASGAAAAAGDEGSVAAAGAKNSASATSGAAKPTVLPSVSLSTLMQSTATPQSPATARTVTVVSSSSAAVGGKGPMFVAGSSTATGSVATLTPASSHGKLSSAASKAAAKMKVSAAKETPVDDQTGSPDSKPAVLDKKALEDKIISLSRTALKPHYHTGRITAQEYKAIMKKAITKIGGTAVGDISERRVTKFINAYVEKTIMER